jgi:secondary thiamine-phosphate synthase enzyme
MIAKLSIKTTGKGLFDFTNDLTKVVTESGIDDGLCTAMVQHTSASLVIQENADPAVQNDLVVWLNRLAAEGDSLYTHTQEGPDDMPAHIKSALTATSLSIPIISGALALGVWQGIYLWEHRQLGSNRSVVIHIGP